MKDILGQNFLKIWWELIEKLNIFKYAEFGKHWKSFAVMCDKIHVDGYGAFHDSHGKTFFLDTILVTSVCKLFLDDEPPECSTCDENAWSALAKRHGMSWNVSGATSFLEFSKAFQRTRSSLLALSLHPDSLNYSIHFCGASN